METTPVKPGLRFIIAAACLICGLAYGAQETGGASTTEPKSLDDNVQDLKSDILDLNRELFILEEELLFPTNTQVAVYLSLDVGSFFQLDSVQIKLDDKVVSNYLYTKLELQSLHRGGIQRIYLGNLRTGSHELVALFTGVGPQGRDYRRGATLSFDKKEGPKYIELKILDNEHKQQPEFAVKEWD